MLKDTPLPNCEFSEGSIIGSVLINNDMAEDVFTVLKPDDFYFNRFRKIIKTMQSLYLKGKHIDVISVHAAMGNDFDTALLSELVDGKYATCEDGEKIQNAIDTVLDRSMRRKFIVSDHEGLSNFYDIESNLDKLVLKRLHRYEQLFDYKKSKQGEANVKGGVQRPISTKDKLLEIIDNQIEYEGVGFSHWPIFSNCYRLNKGKVTVIGGYGEHGKTTVLQHMMVQSIIDHGFKWAVFTPENMPYYLFMRPLIEMYLGCRFVMDGVVYIDKIQCVEALERLNENIYFIDPPREDITVKRIIRMAERIHEKDAIDCLLIDPFNKTAPVYRERESEKEYIRRILTYFTYVSTDNNWCIMNVVHPTKPLRKPGQEKDPVPSLSDMYGSAAWRDGADFGFTVYRDYKRNVVRVYVQKTKFNTMGRSDICLFRYNPYKGGRLEELSKDDINNKSKKIEDEDINKQLGLKL